MKLLEILGCLAVLALSKPMSRGEATQHRESKWDGYDRGVRWHRSIEEARLRARSEGKLVFSYHLVGNLDDREC